MCERMSGSNYGIQDFIPLIVPEFYLVVLIMVSEALLILLISSQLDYSVMNSESKSEIGKLNSNFDRVHCIYFSANTIG